EFKTYNTRLTSENALDIIKDYDVVADGTDNFPTRYLVNDACVLLGKVNVYASIFRFEGQASVFNYTFKDQTVGPNYRDLFPEPPPAGLVPNCAEGGVVGVLPGIMGSIQANEVIKVITGVGTPLAGKLFTFDTLDFSTRVFKLAKDENNALNGKNPSINKLIDYEVFCGIEENNDTSDVKEVSVQELSKFKDEGQTYELVDVREPFEFEIAEIGGKLIPLKQVEERVEEIPFDKKVVVHCRSGVRSAKAIKKLENKYGFQNLYNLKGGILAWADEIDETVAKY
ncbi:MAG: ThiF family adenylyltransferase, partial [Flavobacteriales bacterium]